MENEEIKEQENVETATTDVGETQTENKENEKEPLEEKGKTFTQDQVNDFVRNRINKVYARYGVEDSKGLDDLINKSRSYEVMEERYSKMQDHNRELEEKIAFMTNNINPSRYDDVRAYFKGKSLEFTNDALVNELQTHPEWLNVVKTETPKTTIQSLGGDNIHYKPPKDEKAEAFKLFGLK